MHDHKFFLDLHGKLIFEISDPGTKFVAEHLGIFFVTLKYAHPFIDIFLSSQSYSFQGSTVLNIDICSKTCHVQSFVLIFSFKIFNATFKINQ